MNLVWSDLGLRPGLAGALAPAALATSPSHTHGRVPALGLALSPGCGHDHVPLRYHNGRYPKLTVSNEASAN